MDIAALLLACSVHADDALLLSLAYVHGRGNPYALIDARAQSLDEEANGSPTSPETARAAVQRMVDAGGEPVFGLLPVRLEWASEFGKRLDDLFDVCVDISVASAKLSEFDDACRSRRAPSTIQRRGCTLDRYGRALGLPALRRAVLADLTLSSPFPSDGAENGAVAVELFPSPSDGLFFTVTPMVSAHSLEADSPLPQETP